MGKKKQPIYKIVAADSKSPRDGRFIEAIGVYNPLTNPFKIDIKENILFKWLKRGATPTDTVRTLLKRKGYMLKWRLIKKETDEATIAMEMEKFHLLEAERERLKTEKKLKRKLSKKKKASAPETGQVATAPAENAG